jgi:hypothetical protein
MRNEVPTIKASHGVTDEVHPATDCLVLEEIVERLCSRRNGTGAGYHSQGLRLRPGFWQLTKVPKSRLPQRQPFREGCQGCCASSVVAAKETMRDPEHRIRTNLEVFHVNKGSPRTEDRAPTMAEDNGISRGSYWVKEGGT